MAEITTELFGTSVDLMTKTGASESVKFMTDIYKFFLDNGVESMKNSVASIDPAIIDSYIKYKDVGYFNHTQNISLARYNVIPVTYGSGNPLHLTLPLEVYNYFIDKSNNNNLFGIVNSSLENMMGRFLRSSMEEKFSASELNYLKDNGVNYSKEISPSVSVRHSGKHIYAYLDEVHASLNGHTNYDSDVQKEKIIMGGMLLKLLEKGAYLFDDESYKKFLAESFIQVYVDRDK